MEDVGYINEAQYFKGLFSGVFSYLWTKRKPWGGGGSSAMKKRKLNYRIHNPNTAAATADYILKIFIEANAGKVEKAIQEAAEQVAGETECDEGDSA